MEQLSLPPHQQLCEARLQKAWSLEHVAQTLNLPLASIDALEQAAYEKLHGPAYVMAYMRSYARLLELDADTLIAQYKQQVQQQERSQHEKQLFEAASVKAQHRKYRTGYGVAAALVLMLLLAIFSPDTTQEASGNTGIVIDTAAGTTLISSLDGLPYDNPTLSLMPEVLLLVPQESRAIVLDNPGQAGVSQLNFRFSADCWVEVVDGDNQQIFASLQKTDQVLQLTGKPPFRITLGYAPGVELSYNGQPVDIDASASHTARLVLGNS